MEKTQSLDTICIQGGWKPRMENRGCFRFIRARLFFKYETSEQMGRLFDLEEDGYFYTRLANPTNDAVAEDLPAGRRRGSHADLFRTGGKFLHQYLTSAPGKPRNRAATIYGGTSNLFTVTMKNGD